MTIADEVYLKEGALSEVGGIIEQFRRATPVRRR